MEAHHPAPVAAEAVGKYQCWIGSNWMAITRSHSEKEVRGAAIHQSWAPMAGSPLSEQSPAHREGRAADARQVLPITAEDTAVQVAVAVQVVAADTETGVPDPMEEAVAAEAGVSVLQAHTEEATVDQDTTEEAVAAESSAVPLLADLVEVPPTVPQGLPDHPLHQGPAEQARPRETASSRICTILRTEVPVNRPRPPTRMQAEAVAAELMRKEAPEEDPLPRQPAEAEAVAEE